MAKETFSKPKIEGRLKHSLYSVTTTNLKNEGRSLKSVDSSKEGRKRGEEETKNEEKEDRSRTRTTKFTK